MNWRQFKTTPEGFNASVPSATTGIKPLEPLKPTGGISQKADAVSPKPATLEPIKPLKPAGKNSGSAATPKAWLQDGGLRTVGVIDDLAREIVRLTDDDLNLQRRLLTLHCQAFGPVHIWRLFEAWGERAEILEYAAGLPRVQAEEEAARQYHLLAWLPELRQEPRQGNGAQGGRQE